MTKYENLMQQLKEYFCNLLIIQYRQAPKNRALVKMLVNLVFANNLFSQIYDLTVDVENSVGEQLDVVGRWVGLDRNYQGQNLFANDRFSLVSYESIKNNTYYPHQGGFSNYTNFNTLEGGFLTYKEWYDKQSQVNKMGDDLFRTLIKLKILKNSIYFSRKNIDEAIYQWSNGEVYTTWDKMKITYHYPASLYKTMQIAEEKNVLLKPTGCQLVLVQSN